MWTTRSSTLREFKSSKTAVRLRGFAVLLLLILPPKIALSVMISKKGVENPMSNWVIV